MSDTRREFVRKLGLGAITLAGDIPSMLPSHHEPDSPKPGKSDKSFNMCGYAAPKIDKVRVAFLGLGNRGSGAINRYVFLNEVEIACLCDRRQERLDVNQKKLVDAGLPKAKEYTGEDGWKQMCEQENIDLVYICTPWSMHTPMAVHAMKNGKHVATEVPAAVTLEECWQLVETSEKTKKHCMMLENCCYDFFEITTLNMARQGLFGELMHVEGAYIHDLLSPNFNKATYDRMWRLNENANRNGNLYPTHGLGPIAQCLNINRGDKMDHLVSMSTNDFMMHDKAVSLAQSDSFYQNYTAKKFRGNMNTSIIRTNKGKTIMLQHDVSSPRPYSRLHLISGTKGIAQKYPEPARLAFGHEWLKENEQKEMMEKYTPPIIKHIGELAKKVGGHGGMDFIMDWRLIDCLRNGLPLDQDVYDAAAWSAAGIVSEKSIAKNSRTVEIPDFTKGNWTSNKPVDITLEGGATTTLRNRQKL